MDKSSVLAQIEEYFNPLEKDATHATEGLVKSISKIIKSDRQLVISMLSEWLDDHAHRNLQESSLRIIRDLHINELKTKVSDLKKFVTTKKMDIYLSDFSKYIDKTLSSLD